MISKWIEFNYLQITHQQKYLLLPDILKVIGKICPVLKELTRRTAFKGALFRSEMIETHHLNEYILSVLQILKHFPNSFHGTLTKRIHFRFEWFQSVGRRFQDNAFSQILMFYNHHIISISIIPSHYFIHYLLTI